MDQARKGDISGKTKTILVSDRMLKKISEQVSAAEAQSEPPYKATERNPIDKLGHSLDSVPRYGLYIDRMQTFSIGQLAKAVGVNVETIRYYQRQGFMSQPTKRGIGYRKYGKDDVLRVLFIKKAQSLGFSLKQAMELLSLRVNSRSKCEKVRILAEHKISEIQEKIRSISQMQNALKGIAEACCKAAAY